MRGMKVSEGIHDFRIRTGGLVVYPRLEPAEERHERKWETIPSGIDALDALVGGGLERGTSCLITGTAGAGKSTIASLYTATAARRGEHVIVLCFDERKETFVRRAESLGLGVAEYVEKKRIDLRQIDVGELSLGHLMHLVAESVEKDGATIVVIDSLAGLQHAMPGEKQLLVQLHELLAYLSNKGVLALMVLATHGLFGNETQPVDASYIADTVIFARHFEARGMLRRCISVVKKRYGPHEKSIRELDIQDGGLRVGPPLKEFSGVLTGVPRFEGSPRRLLAENDEEAPRNNA
jgi:circadian clock protein KaiC